MGNVAGVPSHHTVSIEQTPREPLLTIKDLLEVNEVKAIVTGLGHFFHQHGKYQESKRKKRYPKCHGRHHEHRGPRRYQDPNYGEQEPPVGPYGWTPHIVPDHEDFSHDGFTDAGGQSYPNYFQGQRSGYRAPSQHLGGGGGGYHDEMLYRRRAAPRRYSNDRHVGARSRTRNLDDPLGAARPYPHRRRGGRQEYPADTWGEQNEREETNWDERRGNLPDGPFGQGERSPPGKRRR